MFVKGLVDNATHFVKTGKSQQTAQFPWITSDFGDLNNSPYGNRAPGFMLGAPWGDDFGNVFILKIQRSGALTVGQTTQWGTVDAGGGHVTDTATGASTTRVITLTTGGLTVGAETNNFVYDEVIARTGSPLTDGLKLIKANTANTLTVSNLDTKYSNNQADPDAYATAPANTDALTIIRPYSTIVFPTAAAATGMVAGIAVSAVAQNSWYFGQVLGLAMVSAVGSVTALVINSPAVPSGALAGAVIGAAAVAANQVGIAAAAKATAVGLVPLWLTTPSFSY
jgi:predicted outer membrane lipoprotein